MVNWTDIHRGFGKWYGNETYQQNWEQQGLTLQDAQQWISVGLKPTDYKFASYLKQNNIASEQYTHYKKNLPKSN